MVTMSTDEMTQDDLITYMVGRSLDNLYPKEEAHKGDVAMEVRHLTRKGVYNDISFSVRKGEVLGFAGLVGQEERKSSVEYLRRILWTAEKSM